MKAIAWIFGILVFILIIVLPIYWMVAGWHLQTSEGDHTGYITAVERTGIFFKTDTAYVKTDPQSSQEDAYCVVDPKVFDQLKAASQTKENVTVSFISWFAAGIKNCKGEDAVITAVVPAS